MFLEVFLTERIADNAAERLVKTYEDTIPDELLAIWRTVGLGPVGGGLLVLVDPAEMMGELAAWTGNVVGDRTLTPFLRTAFLDLFGWDGEQVWRVDVHLGQVFPTGLDMEAFLDFWLTQDEVADIILRRPLWREARRVLGEPTSEEGFVFVPALCLGGDEEVGHVRRARWPEALSILRNLHGVG